MVVVLLPASWFAAGVEAVTDITPRCDGPRIASWHGHSYLGCKKLEQRGIGMRTLSDSGHVVMLREEQRSGPQVPKRVDDLSPRWAKGIALIAAVGIAAHL